MCLGIVGQIVTLPEEHSDLAMVDVAGMTRPINVAILAGEPLAAGDFILIHAGFAMERIDAATAQRQLAALQDYTGGGTDDPGA